MNINHNHSQNKLVRNPEKMDNQRVFYINDELTFSKDISTTFHSPYKNGKRNNSFVNPTFISNDLFYAKQDIQKSPTPIHNIVYNKNQTEKKQLYQKRMQKVDNFTKSVHQTVATDHSKRQKDRRMMTQLSPHKQLGRSMCKLSIKNEEKLMKQLDKLVKYKQNDRNRANQESRRMKTSSCIQYEPQTPIYYEKNGHKIKQNQAINNKKNLIQWITQSDKIKKINQSIHQDLKKKEVKVTEQYILSNAHENHLKEIESRKNAALLASILREQIKQSDMRKIEQKRQKISLN